MASRDGSVQGTDSGGNSGEDSPAPNSADLQELTGGRHPDLFCEEEEVLSSIRRLHCLDTAALAALTVGSAQVLSSKLALWGYPRDVPGPSLQSEVGSLALLDGAYKDLLGALTPAITRLLAVEYLISRRAAGINSDFLGARALLNEAPVRVLPPDMHAR